MSATNRGSAREASDNYATPSYCVLRLLEKLALPGGLWIEPAAGDGRIIDLVSQLRSDVNWVASEIRPECEEELTQIHSVEQVVIGDFTASPPELRNKRFDVAITNPPYSLAMPFVEESLKIADRVVMLLRLNFLASKTRYKFMSAFPPDVYILPNRPCFVRGKSDNTEYAWFVWDSTHLERTQGEMHVLGLTPAEERK